MLLPKRVKYRKQQRGRMKGAASRGNFVAYGEYGIAACEPGWITSNQIEAARVAMTRSPSVAVRSGSRFSLISLFPKRQSVLEWVPVRADLSSGLQL